MDCNKLATRPLKLLTPDPWIENGPVMGRKIANAGLYNAMLASGHAWEHVRQHDAPPVWPGTWDGVDAIVLSDPWRMPDVAAQTRGRGYRGPILACVHSLHREEEWKHHDALNQLDARCAVVCPSHCAQDYFAVAAPRLTTFIIPWGVDTTRFRPATPEERAQHRRALGWEDRETVTLITGRQDKFDPQDVHFLNSKDARRLVLAGAKGVRNHRGRGYDVVDDPTGDELVRLYQAADRFCSPAALLQETFGLTAIEALACGLPTVLPDWAGYREYGRAFGVGLVGFLPNGKVDIIEMVDKLRYIFGSQKTFPYSARVRSLFSWRNIIPQWEETIKHLWERRDRKGIPAENLRHKLYRSWGGPYADKY